MPLFFYLLSIYMKNIIRNTLAIAGMTALTFSAFNRSSHREIRERANFRSELSSRSDRPREAAHLDHCFQNRNNTTYNDPDNGLYVTDVEHYAQHLMFRNKPEEIGMTREGNEWALDQMHDRIVSTNAKRGIRWDREDWDREVGGAMNAWDYYYNGEPVEA